MRNYLLLTGFLLIFRINVCYPDPSSEIKYKVADIPKSLLTDAKAVIRINEKVFEITDINRAVEKVTYAITILNQNGIDNSIFIEFYNKFLNIRKVEWNFYDQSGNPIKNNSNTELLDYSAISGFSIYEDDRVKLLDPKYRTTPFTVEYTYERVYNGLLSYPEWKAYEDYNISVEKSKLTIITPKGFKFRYQEKNLNVPPAVTDGKDKTTYSWEIINQPAIREEPFSIDYIYYTPVVYAAPNDFEIGGYKGNLENWKNFGLWINKLNEGRDILSPETIEKVKKLIADKKSDYEKIWALYNYMQDKVRYVSIQVGIGGWQTIDAQTVDKLSYGDCKALSNYMKSLLKIAGIKSYYTLVMAGTDLPQILEDFPSNQFNHVMVCVPLLNDTIWLECTSQHLPAGYIGKFTDNRKVLLIADEGGFLVKTKEYTLSDNLRARKAIVNLGTTGSAETTIKTSYRGANYDDVYNVLFLDETDRKKNIQKRITIPSYNLLSYSHTEKKQVMPSIDEELKLELPNFGTIMGTRMLINPNLISRFGKLPYRTRERKSVISVKRPLFESDSINVTLPLNIKVDQLPEKCIIASRFGEYSTDFSTDGKSISYIRKFKFYKGEYPASYYQEFIDFCEKISNADEVKIALVKTN
jgi:transglutaminase-like putative cysteine protease